VYSDTLHDPLPSVELSRPGAEVRTRSLLRRIAGLFSVGVLGQLAAIAAGIAQARVLGPDGKAVLAFAVLALSMVLIGTDGITGAVLLQAGRKTDSLARIYTAVLGVVTIVALPCMTVALVIGIIAPSQRPLLGAALAIPFALYAQGGRGLLLALGATAAVAWQGAITSVFFSAVVIAALLIWHVSSYEALALWFIAQAAAAGYTALVLQRRIARSSSTGNEHSLGELFREQLRFGSRSSLATVAGYINLRIDVFLISALLGPRMLGIYTLAVSTGEMLWSISLPVIWAALENIAGDTFAEAAKLAAGLMRSVVALQVILGIVLFIAGPWLIVHVYGPAFAGAGTVLRILLPGLVVYAVETFLGYFILVQVQRPLLLFAVQSTSAVLCAVLTLLLLGRFGMNGAAAATSVTYVGVVVFKSLYFRRKTGIGLRQQWLVTADDVRALYRRVRRRVPQAT
jgi:O-antigen/teichoic acid export membrane protein